MPYFHKSELKKRGNSVMGGEDEAEEGRGGMLREQGSEGERFSEWRRGWVG